MSVRLPIILVAAFLCALPLRAAGADPAALLTTLRIPEMIAVMQDEGLAYGEELEDQLFPGAGGSRWDEAVARVYDEPALLARFQSAFAARLAADPQAMEGIAGFFGTDRGQQILTLEIGARRALLDEAVEEAAAVSVDDMRARDDPRLALLERFVTANDLIEQNVSGALNANFAFYQGMSDGGAFDGAKMTEAEMLAEVWSQEADIRAETESWLYPFLALAYKPLSDADVEAYVAFSESGAGRAMNAAMFAAFNEVFSAISRDLGRAAAQMLSGQDI
ncbi:MAG: DUF2059 domain-containing protein [Rhodobacter sp.]|nr:DUF2059 domain-containing protein [Rhodobacter sp.]MCA3514353.1 DUF2059 domain-containing protein [Rhodobacter sp.]MCA3521238.1 DUF2059 domain-containing protein [Rhodobacter sp.]MCA3523726.1 DUF2059 domain-containing protein [Rhodobacter sp.]MCA3527111.1 DUF2059 domain-containing protein [Rhodobacter sp.]